MTLSQSNVLKDFSSAMVPPRTISICQMLIGFKPKWLGYFHAIILHSDGMKHIVRISEQIVA